MAKRSGVSVKPLREKGEERKVEFSSRGIRAIAQLMFAERTGGDYSRISIADAIDYPHYNVRAIEDPAKTRWEIDDFEVIRRVAQQFGYELSITVSRKRVTTPKARTTVDLRAEASRRLSEAAKMSA